MKKRRRHQTWEELKSEVLKDPEMRFRFEQEVFYLRLAHLIADLRKKKGITQAELAKRAKVSQPFISRLEKGDHMRVPTFETIHKLLHALGYSLEISAIPERKKAA